MTTSSMHRHDVFVSKQGTKSFLSALQLYVKSSLEDLWEDLAK